MFLPARLPNLLLNGTSGIAVGMATDIPPHNLREVASACIHLLEEPEATTAQLMKFVKGPDLPTGAEIISPRADLEGVLREGRRQLQGARHLGDTRTATSSSPPCRTRSPPTKVQEQIAEQMRAKKLPMVEDAPRRVRPREPDAPRDRAALQPRRHRPS